MANLLEQAIECDDGDNAANLIRDALGIESDEVATYVFPKTWPANRDQRAGIIGEWLKAEGRSSFPHRSVYRSRITAPGRRIPPLGGDPECRSAATPNDFC